MSPFLGTARGEVGIRVSSHRFAQHHYFRTLFDQIGTCLPVQLVKLGLGDLSLCNCCLAVLVEILTRAA